ncbi:MAG: PAS domain-containing protein [Chlorobiaceae bacterium]|nr:PAS domain-containing protein [Chlorobiaceae bacterium]
MIEKALLSGKSCTEEENHNGKRFAYTFHPLPFQHGHAPCLFVTVKETAPHKRDYEPGNRQLWEKILDKCGLGVWSLNLESGIVYRTPGHDRLFGYDEPVKEWGNEVFLEHVVEEDREKVLRIFDEIKTNRDSWDTEFRVRRKDGALRWFSSVGGLMKDEQGKTIILSGISRDITEEKTARIEHENFHSKMNYALENSHVGIWDLDMKSGMVNRTLEHDRIFGYDSLLPVWTVETFFHHIDPEDIASVRKLFESDIESKSDFKFECRIRKATGDLRWINLTGTFSLNETSNEDHIVGIIQDITDRKLAEIEREKLQTQLQQSQKMELVGQLAGGIAHDFNNVLSAILANTEVILNQVDENHPYFENLDGIRLAAHRSTEMVAHLLAFARKQVWRPRLIDLEEELMNIHAMLRSLIKENIEFRWLLQPRHAMVSIDPSHLVQIITNLSVNARDAITGEGAITIETRTVKGSECEYCDPSACEGSDEWVMLSVSDTGSGITEEGLSRIFEPFYTTKEKGKGTGLGLAVVYGIVKQNRGFIECRSEQGKGTSFHVFFPKSRGPETATEQSVPLHAAATESSAVLLVEDEPDILKVIKTLLEARRFEVLPAENAEKAWAVFLDHRERIGMVISDVMLPGVNGVELVRKLRQENPGLKYIFMSGYGFEAFSHTEEFGRNVNFITKPFGIKEFLELVNTVNAKAARLDS